MAVRNLDNEELKRWIADYPDLQLLDVRTPPEYFQLGHIPGARLLPIHEIPDRLDSLDPARKTAVVCEHGIRSSDASHYLHHHGFGDIGHLTAGMAEWDGPRKFED